jgi:hypothetical protein
MSVRRVVTSHDDVGRSIVSEDTLVRRSHDYRHIKGFSGLTVRQGIMIEVLWFNQSLGH